MTLEWRDVLQQLFFIAGVFALVFISTASSGEELASLVSYLR